eukprot:scaffold464099_cov35-Prasinocladus_malaysianus.AAC.2
MNDTEVRGCHLLLCPIPKVAQPGEIQGFCTSRAIIWTTWLGSAPNYCNKFDDVMEFFSDIGLPGYRPPAVSFRRFTWETACPPERVPKCKICTQCILKGCVIALILAVRSVANMSDKLQDD